MPRNLLPTIHPPAAVKRARERVQALAPLPADAKPWYRIEAVGDEARVYLHDEIGYWGTTSSAFVRELREYAAKDLRVHINSPGGDVFDGLAIFNALASHPKRVTTHVDSLAASAASFIALAGDQVVMEPNAMLMIHDAQGLGVGNAAELREYAELLDTCSNTIAKVYADKAGGTVESWRKAMAKDKWFTATEAVSAGLVDEVVDRTADNAWRDSVSALLGQPFEARIHRDRTFSQLLAGLTRGGSDWDSVTQHLKENNS